MADVVKPLGTPDWVPVTQTDWYTAPSTVGSAVIIKGIRAVNTSNADVQFDMWVGGTGDNKILISEKIVAGGDLTDDTFHVMAASEHIYVRAGTASVIALRISGMETPNT